MTRTIRKTTTKLHWLLAGLFAVVLIAPAMVQAADRDTLRSGEVIRGLDARRGQSLSFRIYVPRRAESLTVRTAGGQGDADLYIRHEGNFGTSRYDGRSARPDSEERVVIERPAEGWWEIQLVAFSRFRDVSLKAVVDTRGGGHGDHHRITELRNNRSLQNLTGIRGQELRFRIDVPHRTERLDVRTYGGVGDVDLFLARGEIPEPRSAQYRSASPGTGERIVVENPRGGEWFVVVYGYENFRKVDILARMQAGHGGHHGQPRGALRLIEPDRGETYRLGEEMTIRWRHRDVERVNILYSLDNGRRWQVFQTDIDADRDGLRFRLPDQDRFISDAVRIRIEDADNRRVAATTGRFAILPRHDRHRPWDQNPRDRRDDRHDRRARHDDIDAIRPGQTVRNIEIDEHESKTYRLFVPAGARRVEFLTGGGDEQPVQMFVDLGQLPTRNAPLRSTRRGALQRVRVDDPRSGWWYVTLYAPGDEVEGLELSTRVR